MDLPENSVLRMGSNLYLMQNGKTSLLCRAHDVLCQPLEYGVPFMPKPQTFDPYEYFAGTKDGDQGFDIHMIFEGDGWTPAQKRVVAAVLDYWSYLLHTDISDYGSGSSFVDDIKIKGVIEYIDGKGGTLGSASPVNLHPDSLTTLYGQFRFDTADVSSWTLERLVNVAFHEIGHIVGFGSLWAYKSLIKDVDNLPFFIGPKAVDVYKAECARLGMPANSNGVPVEPGSNSGTSRVHWKENNAMFRDEVMSGYLTGSSFLSPVTMASIDDLGYKTRKHYVRLEAIRPFLVRV